MTVGLVVFIVAIGLDVMGLLLDWAFQLAALPTLTGYVRKHGWAGVVVLGLQMVGAAGLAWHFWS